MNNAAKHIIRLVVLILLQALLINNLHWLGIFHPSIYIIGLLLLPATLSRTAELFIGAAVGLIMDIIYSTAGAHMAACVAVAYFRPLLIHQLVQDANRIGTQVCSASIGPRQFIILASLMIALHQVLVLFLEAWSLDHTGWLILSALCSAGVTILLAWLYDRTQR